MNSFSNIQNFNTLFNKYYTRFTRFSMSYVRDRESAEDIVSEAFALFWENRSSLRPETNPAAYILTIVKNKCLNHLQHLQVRGRAEKEINEHSEWVLSLNINSLQACDPYFIFSDEIQQIISSTLNKLPEKTRRIFILNRYEGFSYKNIAEQLDLSQKTVEFHISKALNLFRTSLKDFMPLFSFLVLLSKELPYPIYGNIL